MKLKNAYCLIVALFTFILISCTHKTALISKVANSTGCDTLNVKYHSIILPLLKDSCFECHSTQATSRAGGLDLENFSSLRDYLKYYYHNDSIYGSKFLHVVQQVTGTLSMPPTGKLSDCQLTQLRNWIRDGAPNN